MKFCTKLTMVLLLLILLCGCTLPGQDPDVTLPSLIGDGMTIHFIDVGQADCALLECDGAYILIDGGNVEDSSLVVSYLQQQGVDELSAVICSHAHEDHVGGLPGVLAVYPTEAVYAPTRTYSSGCFDDFLYYTDQQGLEVTIPEAGDTIPFGSAIAQVLGPVQQYAEPNNTSIVLKVTYGSTSFLFTGDMEISAETDLLDSGANVKTDVLKVGHHGSDTSTGYRFLYEAEPEHAIISVGTGNSYGHPNEATLSRLEDAGCTIYRTDKLGHIIAHSDGTNITFIWEDSSATPETGEPVAVTYIGNTKSKKLHVEGCSSLPGEQNRITFDSYDQAIEAGYTPCGNCMG